MPHPWLTALLLGTVATPGAVILAVPAPRPVDAVLAWPLVVLDVVVGSRSVAPAVRLVAIAVGIGLTWVHYVLLARLVVWRMMERDANGS